MPELLEESERLGLPMTQADLKPQVQIPDDQNAAIEVVRLAEEAANTNVTVIPKYYLAGTPERADLEADIQTVSPFLDGIAEELAGKPEWFIDRDYDLGLVLPLVEYGDFKAVAKYLAFRSFIRAERSDIEGALGDLRAGRELRLRILNDPVLVASLVVIAIDAIMLRASEHVMTAWADDPDALAQLAAVLAETDHRIDPRPALRGEFYYLLAIMRNLKQYGGLTGLGQGTSGYGGVVLDPDNVRRSGLPSDMFARAFSAAIAEEWNALFRSFEGLDEPPRGWGAGIDRRAKRMKERYKVSETYVQILMPVFGKVDVTLTRNDVVQQLRKALVKVLRFRAENGHLPASLEEAGAAFPDVFNEGAQLQAILTEDEVRIWSIGPDGIDDLGVPRDTVNRDRDDLAVFWPATKRTEYEGR